ncbi:LOW QUALITY PROTEIN: hypothetical protein Cgig2_000208 [Carnegiea gigantea]|uniref:PLAT domain-containing protein n=1 Tax=Carnegiea gigantea TaxID=171969 RepID=A0A9Q1GNU2_9CARY|nr:LOW QUALITY PROTEIN: hypothetical protein Cgig2_000236 [Carnegiea gigantea]KAJ8445896.1 LOW QUALITY PROTEIN: hypothetical protein Cgig2_000208 [Carnegiea gigantea]
MKIYVQDESQNNPSGKLFVNVSRGCTYRVEVKTGDRNWAGTAAIVNLHLCSTRNTCFLHIPDLSKFGMAGPSYPYFRLGNHDFFRISTRQGCQKVCKISIGHNNAGSSPGWFLDYVKVDVYDGGVVTYRDLFNVYQWIAKGGGYKLQVDVNHCPVIKAAAAQLASVLPLQSGVA